MILKTVSKGFEASFYSADKIKSTKITILIKNPEVCTLADLELAIDEVTNTKGFKKDIMMDGSVKEKNDAVWVEVFAKDGSSFFIVTNMATFLMSDEGKNIERLM